MSNELTFVPLNKLVRSSLNVRKTGAESIDDLAASIAVHGLLQNLTVTKKSATGKTKSKADTYEVCAQRLKLANVSPTFSAPNKTAAQVGEKAGWLRAMGSSRRSA